MQLIITLDKKNHLASSERSSGKWEIYLHSNGQRDRIVERNFGHDTMEEELIESVQELSRRVKLLD